MGNLGYEKPGTPHGRHPSQRELGWIAGFLEGEGCFNTAGSNPGTQRVTAVQKQREPLLRLQELLGGRVYPRFRDGCFGWSVTGARARGIMLTLYALMSPRRKDQIRAALWFTK